MRIARHQLFLMLGGVANYFVALFHLVIVFVGAPGYRYFGVPELAEMQAKGSAIPIVLTLALTIVFALCATYALSGAGVLRRLPLLRTILLAVGAVYLLRGLTLVQIIILLLAGKLHYLMAVAFSGAALLIGIAYIAGTIPLCKRREEKSQA